MSARAVDLALASWRAGRRVVSRHLGGPRHREPIVLMHGFMGFARLGPIEYFVGVKEALELEGFAVHTPTVDPLNTFEYRAYEWFFGHHPGDASLEDVERVHRPPAGPRGRFHRTFRPHLAQLYLDHRAPLHLVAHSQAAIDARFLASPEGLGSWQPFDDPSYPDDLRATTVADCIASVTTVGGPHNGVLMADDTDLVNRFVEHVLIPGVDDFISLFSHDRSDLYRAAREFGRAYMLETFNPRYTDHPRIPYRTIAGVTNEFQVTLFLRPFYSITRYHDAFERDDNDGFVPVGSAKWPVLDASEIPSPTAPSVRDYVIEPAHRPRRHGRWEFLGLVYADHVNEIGFPFSYPRNHIFHHLRMYSGLARLLLGELDDDVRLMADGSWRPIDTAPDE